MSKLADAIRRSQRIESAPMGFGAARPAPKPSLLVGYLAKDAAEAEKAKAAGADVIVVRSTKSLAAADVEKLHAAADSTPLGLWAPVDGAAEGLDKAGLDFLVVDPETTPAAALLNEELGYLLVLPEAPDELLLRSIEPLSLDGLYLANLPSPLTVARQIELTRIVSFAHKPLICPVPSDVAKEELQCLRAAGAVLLLVEGSPEGIGKLKETVLSLPARRGRRDERPVVSLPRGAMPADNGDNDDDDE